MEELREFPKHLEFSILTYGDKERWLKMTIYQTVTEVATTSTTGSVTSKGQEMG